MSSVASTSTMPAATMDSQMSKAARKEEKRRRKEQGAEKAKEEDVDGDVSMSSVGDVSEKRHKKDKHKSKDGREKEERRREKHARKEAKAAAAAAPSSQGSESRNGGAVVGEAESAFRYVYPVMQVSAPPVLAHNPKRAVQELLDTLLMRYVPQLDGVLLAHRQITLTRSHACIDSNSAYASFPVGLTALVWAPRIGMRLEGQLKLSTPSHISLLVHGIFNASITAAHLPSTKSPTMTVEDEQYEWHNFEDGEEYAEPNEDGETGAEEANGDEEMMTGEKSTGYWRNRETGARLGEDTDGRVSFTVVGLTIANNLLSLYGSLLKAPFSVPAPSSIPQPAGNGRPNKGAASTSTEPARRVRFRFQEDDDDEDDDDDDEEEGGADAGRAPPNGRAVGAPELVESHRKRKKERRSEGPRRKDEASASEGESEGELSSHSKREKKRRKKAEGHS